MGWRWTIPLCVRAGFATIMMLTMFEPKRQGAKEIKAASGGEERCGEGRGSQAYAYGDSRVSTDPHTAFLLLAASIRFMGGYAIAGYLLPFTNQWSSLTVVQ